MYLQIYCVSAHLNRMVKCLFCERYASVVAIIKMNHKTLWELFEIHVISRCGIFNGQTSDLPQYPHTSITTHAPSPISPTLSVPHSVSHTHKFNIHTLLNSLSSLLPECSTNKSYTCVAIWRASSYCSLRLRNHCSGEVHKSVMIYPSFFYCLPLSFSLCVSYYSLFLLSMSVQHCCDCINPVTVPLSPYKLILTVNLSFRVLHVIFYHLIQGHRHRPLTSSPSQLSSSLVTTLINPALEWAILTLDTTSQLKCWTLSERHGLEISCTDTQISTCTVRETRAWYLGNWIFSHGGMAMTIG